VEAASPDDSTAPRHELSDKARLQCGARSAETMAEMLWSFHRAGEHLMYEIRTRADASGFELLIRKGDGSETVERFDDQAAVDRRSAALQRELLDAGWWVAGDPAGERTGISFVRTCPRMDHASHLQLRFSSLISKSTCGAWIAFSQTRRGDDRARRT
jgi:hypothetical protein